MILTSPAFDSGESIPKKYTCDGGEFNPELQIQNVPSGTKSLALVMRDPDAPMPGGFTHWVVWNIDPKTSVIKEESVPPGATEGQNSSGNVGYAGPCPPSGTHHYHFQLYALSDMLDLSTAASVSDAQAQIDQHLVEQTELIGLYSRESKG